MSVRNFPGDAVITLSPGSSAPTSGNPYTFAFLVKRNSTGTWQPLITGVDSGGVQSWFLGFQGPSGGTGVNRLQMDNSAVGGDSNSTFTVTDTTEYKLIAFSCPGSFGTMGRWHIMNADGTWTHEAGTEPGTPLRGLGAITSFKLGEGAGAAHLDGRLPLAGVWLSEMTDSQVEALGTNKQADDWVRHQITPSSIWVLTQSSTGTPLTDYMGNGADQTAITGTAVVSDDPPGWDLVPSPLPLRAYFNLSGGAANTDPAVSIGGAKSSARVSGALFDDVSFSEAATGLVDYRLVYVVNEDTRDATAATAFVSGQLEVGREIALGVATQAAGATVTAIANDHTAPAGVTFAPAPFPGVGLSMGAIAAGSFKGLWIRRTINAGTATDPTNPWECRVNLDS